ncbi:MAG: hypothetical protein PVJ02_00670 [Gemmatimonadota bacterium]|jgi:hypothetical protein
MKAHNLLRLGAVLAALAASPALVYGQADEIQVYDGGLAGRGVFNLTLHNNFTPRGIRAPAFPGAIVSDHSLNGVPEWAYGVTDWFEAGLYLPLYSVGRNHGGSLDGFKLRTLFAVPHADDRTFFYGVNFEFSYNAAQWDPTRFTSEIRPIVGWHLRSVDLVFNPILDTSYDGFRNLDFAPSTRVAYNVSPIWAVAVEEYADFGPLRQLAPAGEQSHQLYGVVDHASPAVDMELGVGFGLTSASDAMTFKLILSRDLAGR